MPARLTISQITQAAISFAAVVLAYWVYSLLAVPFIEPVAAERASSGKPDDPREFNQPKTRHADLLESLYPDPSSWQRKRPKIVETQQALLLLKDYRTLEDGRMEIKPCTLLFIDQAKQPRHDGHPGRVVVLDAPEGAILQFDNDLDVRRAEFGRLIGGRLAGNVTIRSNESEPGADDRIYLATRNVNMDERRAWTPNEVTFRYGRSYGSGRDLIMTFLPAAETSPTQRGPNIGGLKSLELVHLGRLHLVTGGSVFSDSPGREKAGSQQPTRQQPSPVEVTCKGPFLFDLENALATFEEQVDVLRLNPNGPSDQLNCRLLEIHFSGLSPTALRRRAKDARTSSKVSKIVALGYPVVLQSPSLAAYARGERLEYDMAQRQLRLDGEQPVVMEHQGRRIEALAVQYHMPAEGRIGRAWAQGPGKFRAELPTEKSPPEAARQGPRVITANWKDELHLQPDGEGHVLSLRGEAKVGDGQFGGLAAGEIHLWLKETANDLAATKTKNTGLSVLPDRLLAEGGVQIDSPALTGNTDRFEVWFQHVPRAALARNQPSKNDHAQRRQPPWESDNQQRSRFDVSGRVLRVLLAAAGKQVQLRDVSVEGDARIVETRTAQADDSPARIAGDFIHVTAADSPQAKAVVAGKPAIVSGRGVTLKGATVHLERATNRMWIPGEGEATLPLAGRLGKAAPPPKTAQAARVHWHEGMQFDGQTIRIRGRVTARTDQQRISAPLVDISLTSAVDFNHPPATQNIHVEEIHLQGQVTMENRAIENGRLASIDEMMVRDLTINQLSGALSADGPGWIKTVRRGGDLGPRKFAGPAFGNNAVNSARDNHNARDDGLTYLRVTFQTAMTGNINRRIVQLHEGVRTVYGQVRQWNEAIDPDRALESHEDVVLLTSDTLQVAEMGPPTNLGGNGSASSPRGLGPVELQALGNAMVEGSTFTARAHRIAYAQAKELLVMEGDGRTDAELYRQSTVGGQTGRASARKILYWPSTGRMDVDTFNSLDWTGPPVAADQPSPLPSGVGDYFRRERQSRPQHFSTAPP